MQKHAIGRRIESLDDVPQQYERARLDTRIDIDSMPAETRAAVGDDWFTEYQGNSNRHAVGSGGNRGQQREPTVGHCITATSAQLDRFSMNRDTRQANIERAKSQRLAR